MTRRRRRRTGHEGKGMKESVGGETESFEHGSKTERDTKDR